MTSKASFRIVLRTAGETSFQVLNLVYFRSGRITNLQISIINHAELPSLIIIMKQVAEGHITELSLIVWKRKNWMEIEIGLQ